MFERTFKFTVRFLDGNSELNEFVSVAKLFFENCQQVKFTHSISVGDVYKCMDDFNCDAELYEIVFTITCTNVKRDSDVENFASAIGRQWCNKANSNEFLHWLLPDRQNLKMTNYNNHYGNAKASEFAFGSMPDMKNFVQSYIFRERQGISSILCSFSHLERHFVVYISNKHANGCNYKGEMGHKVLILYDSLIRIIANIDPDKNAVELFLHMEHPPFIYITRSDVEEAAILPNRISKAKEMELSKDKFERTFELGCECNHTLCTNKLKIGKAPVVKVVIPDKFQARWLIEQLIVRRAHKTEICFTAMNTVKVMENAKKAFPWSPGRNISDLDKFTCEYAWKALCSRSFAIFHQIVLKNQKSPNYAETLWTDLSNAASENPSAFAKTLFHISDMVDQGVIFNFQTTFKKKFMYFCHFVELNKLPKGMCCVRRVIITPSKIIFQQPYEHFDNRIVRKFGEEYMLRVSVKDDNFSKLTYAVQYNLQKETIMKEIVGKVLLHGLSVGSRRYEVLASSSSQLREHGLWMYAADPHGNTASSIRQWMGDFSAIKNVAKYMARMGQCLSTTEEGVQVCVDSSSEILLDDIKSRDGRYIFSDGIGIVSSSLAKEVRLALMKSKGVSISDPNYYQPSAFQFRYKGCKGMVVEDPTTPGRAIGIRPSMKKFECYTSNHLEIVKTSAPRKLYLNKHLVTILEQMGIPKETFLDLQSDMMLNLLDSLINENLAASLLLHNVSIYFPFKELHTAGISLTTEPFFRSLLLSVFKSLAAKLRSSMRIAIPEEYGRNMLAVLDETKTLKYNQVFVQYSESTSDPDSKVKILKGPVIVTKNPSLHPGDVRKLTAVDVPALHHIKDCIVFPARGPRPHPDEMAGSDLDGDECVVLWCKPLIFQRRNYKPMDYPVYEETSCKDNIELTDMVEFFCHYIQNDCIGSFAHAHLVLADKLKDGIFSSQCMSISKRYPYVLDFAKHGTTKYLKKSERPDQYPDFLQKGLTANSYHSKRALGSLYRVSRVLDACSSKINIVAESSQIDPDLEYPGWQHYEESAEKHKQSYVGMLTEILKRYNLKFEAEAFTGIVELKAVKKWRQEHSDTAKVIKSYVQSLMMTFRNIFSRDVQEEIVGSNLDEADSLKRKFQRASAWYMVVYGKPNLMGLSFPWILSDVLADIKLSMKRKVDNKNVFLVDIDADIQLCMSSSDLKVNTDQNGCCLCWTTVKSILFEWISKARLNIFSKNKSNTCDSCFKRIISHFELNGKIYCCSASRREDCTCSEFCSPTKLALTFFKFFVKNTKDSIGSCTDGCDGFIARNLQELSLQTLAYLAITRNVSYLGLQVENLSLAKSTLVPVKSEGIFEEEGDPLKIPVKTDVLKNVLENYRDEVMMYLKKNSGVQYLFLRPEKDLRDNLCLVVNSSGKNWQRWNLQEILLDPNFTENIVSYLKRENSLLI